MARVLIAGDYDSNYLKVGQAVLFIGPDDIAAGEAEAREGAKQAATSANTPEPAVPQTETPAPPEA